MAIIIDKSGQNGNIFAIIGVFRNVRNQMEKAGVDVSDYDELLDGYMSMSYDEILGNINYITNNYIQFRDGTKPQENIYL